MPSKLTTHEDCMFSSLVDSTLDDQYIIHIYSHIIGKMQNKVEENVSLILCASQRDPQADWEKKKQKESERERGREREVLVPNKLEVFFPLFPDSNCL